MHPNSLKNLAAGSGWNRGKSLSETHRKRISVAKTGHPMYLISSRNQKISAAHLGMEKPWVVGRRGALSHFWKGGVSSENDKIRRSAKYRKWRKAVFERDRYTCVKSGAKSKKGVKVYLNADHIKRFADYPKLRFRLSNGRTLCIKCHRKTNTYGRTRKILLER